MQHQHAAATFSSCQHQHTQAHTSTPLPTCGPVSTTAASAIMHTPGWGTSFHFAHRLKHESHVESIRRHEHYLALRLGLAPGDKARARCC